MKIKIFYIILLLLHCNCSFAQEIEIKHADSLEADKQEIKVKGNIVINYKDAIIEAPEGYIETNEQGEHDKAIFNGRAKLKLKDRRIEADKITVSIKEKTIYAEGNTFSELKDKNNDLITITSDYQELRWDGNNANARGNLKTTYLDTKVTAEEASIIYKENKPDQALFFSKEKISHLEQPTNITYAKEFVIDVESHDLLANGNVKSIIWPDKKKSKSDQDPVHVSTEKLFIENATGTITAESKINQVNLTYQDTKGKSNEATLLRNSKSGKPDKIIFKGAANVVQEDKEITSEEVIFNFEDKKLTSNTKTNIRPKTVIYKKE